MNQRERDTAMRYLGGNQSTPSPARRPAAGAQEPAWSAM